MTKTDKWADRVAAWRASGKTSEDYCSDKDFTAGALRHWSSRLKRVRGAELDAAIEGAPALRLARVVRRRRRPAGAPAARRQEATSGREPDAALPTIEVSLGDVRVVVRDGFRRATLLEVLTVLEERRARVGGRR
ncbi:MAG: hypothetical protein U0230_15955 [Polyangiales bacterium]